MAIPFVTLVVNLLGFVERYVYVRFVVYIIVFCFRI